ncbi:MAG: hypothetical protein A3D35_02815 [Candidatus Staskawiczbacteria bacterium RIFCSPHIGHO2_02_FULL_34_9]|uniref:Prepilin-type N-terminal cleavage/methylation domain-containing protein n=1 Tax=Candidatus Staskawiczbacteria bacterium RIFCSPHIGHO2_02_FULL_34_9 TaxID=1802206 RepID=A0A1G2HX12_9BACT|nr:MAG: hypothetical protein A3D35_02815 [Candidatus Staskawiczbacteria bacterium RIFCSPHIGHO2_02_FULL_34_9]
MGCNTKNLICFMFHVPCSVKQKGVTLIELVVVLGVISIIISATVGIFTSFVRQQSRILSEQELLSQTSYALEYISRSVRDAVKDTSGSCTGTPSNYYTLSHFDSVSGSYQGVKVLSSDNVCHEFFLDADGILKEIKDGQIAQPILSGNFDIQYARFIISGDKTIASVSSSGLTQPRVSVSLSFKLQSGQQERERIIQTTIGLQIQN